MLTKSESIQKQPKPRNRITYTRAPLPAEGLVRLPSVLACLGISKNSFLAGVKNGIYPSGRLLTPRCRVWHVNDIRAFLASLENGGSSHEQK